MEVLHYKGIITEKIMICTFDSLAYNS